MTSRSEFFEARTESLVFQGDHESLLLDLLAVIHRDGGHYVQKHGLAKAVIDAMKLSAERLP